MSSEKPDWSKSLDREVSIRGTAQNAKAGPLLTIGAEDVILIRGMDQWDAEVIGKEVMVEAVVRRVPGYPKAGPPGKRTMQGSATGGDIWVLELKDYKILR
jgi:hypothetical protein